MEQFDFIIIIVLMVIMYSFSILFLYCFLGKFATDNFGGMSDCLYNADWYELTVGLQKYFIIMIRNTQKPLYYHGLGIVVLNLETFCKVRIIPKSFLYIISLFNCY